MLLVQTPLSLFFLWIKKKFILLFGLLCIYIGVKTDHTEYLRINWSKLSKLVEHRNRLVIHLFNQKHRACLIIIRTRISVHNFYKNEDIVTFSNRFTLLPGKCGDIMGSAGNSHKLRAKNSSKMRMYLTMMSMMSSPNNKILPEHLMISSRFRQKKKKSYSGEIFHNIALFSLKLRTRILKIVLWVRHPVFLTE